MSFAPLSPPRSDAGDAADPVRTEQEVAQPSSASSVRLADRFDALARVSTQLIEEEEEESRTRKRVKLEDDAAPGPSRSRRSTSVRNCDGCRVRKTKCDRGRPCGHCVLREKPCTYAQAGPDPWSGNRHVQNLADIARLRQHVFMLARQLGLTGQELLDLTEAADKLDEDGSPLGSAAGPRTAHKRPLSEILRDGAHGGAAPPGRLSTSPPNASPSKSPLGTPPSSRGSTRPPSSSLASELRGSPAALAGVTSLSSTPTVVYPYEVVYSPDALYSPYSPDSPYSLYPTSMVPASHHVVYYVTEPTLAPSPHFSSSATIPPPAHPAHAVQPFPSFPSQSRSHALEPRRVPGLSTTTSLGATTSAQRASPALLPPITIPTSLPNRPYKLSSASSLASAFSALRTASTALTTPSTAASPCPAGFDAPVPPPPNGGYRLPPPKPSPGGRGVGARLDGFVGTSGGERRDEVRREPSQVESGAGGDPRNSATEEPTVMLPPLRLSLSAQSTDAQDGAAETAGEEVRRVRLPSLREAVAEKRDDRDDREEREG